MAEAFRYVTKHNSHIKVCSSIIIIFAVVFSYSIIHASDSEEVVGMGKGSSQEEATQNAMIDSIGQKLSLLSTSGDIRFIEKEKIPAMAKNYLNCVKSHKIISSTEIGGRQFNSVIMAVIDSNMLSDMLNGNRPSDTRAQTESKLSSEGDPQAVSGKINLSEAIKYTTAESGPGSSEPECIEIIASGTGISKDSARDSAFSTAIEQAVGQFVDAETQLKNEQLIKDQILTFSNGYIQKYDIVSEDKQPDGLVKVKIKALVKKRQLIEKIKASNITTTKFDGKSVYAEIETTQKSNEDAAKLLEKEFEGIPENLMYAYLIENKPEIVSKTDKMIKLKWKVALCVDEEKYYNNFMPRILQLLKETSILFNDNEVIFKPVDRSNIYALKHINDCMAAFTDFDTFRTAANNAKSFDEKNNIAIFVNTRRTKTDFITAWKCYILDKDALTDLINKYSAKELPKIKISFMSDKGNYIYEDLLDLKQYLLHVPLVKVMQRYGSEDSTEDFKIDRCIFSSTIPRSYIHPFFEIKDNRIIFSAKLNFNYECEIPIESLKDISDIKLNILP